MEIVYLDPKRGRDYLPMLYEIGRRHRAYKALTGMLASEAGGYSIYNRDCIGTTAYDIAANMMFERARRREAGR
jgi:hypothetical protein